MKMEEIQSPSLQTDAEINWLDILVTISENIRLLVIGSLLGGLCALGIGYVLPQTFESVAVFAVLQGEQATASLMTTAAVLDPVVTKLGLDKDASIDEARRELQQSIKVSVGRNDKFVTLAVLAPTAQRAQATAAAVLEQTYLQSRPKGTLRARLEVQLTEVKNRLKNAESAADGLRKRFESPVSSNFNSGTELARGYADLLGIIGIAQKQSSDLEALLEGLSNASLVQSPTLPQNPKPLKKAALALGAALGAVLSLLLFIFIRQALRNSAKGAETADKLLRIRQALGGK